MSTDSQSQTSTRLHGRVLFLARLLWAVLVGLTLMVFIAAIPVIYEYFLRLPPKSALALRQLGLSANVFAIYILALETIVALGCIIVSAVIFWRKSDDRMALLLSLALVTFPSVSERVAILARTQPSWTWLVGFLWSFSLGAVFITIYLFPDGRFVPHWMRWMALGVVAWALGNFFFFSTRREIFTVLAACRRDSLHVGNSPTSGYYSTE